MALSKRYRRGRVSISMNAVATIAGKAAMECYGVVGMASKKSFTDDIAEILNTENYCKGVFAKNTADGIEINMYIIVAYGVKITEVVSEVQKKVRYVLKKDLDVNFKAINVCVQDTKIL
jgi:uncharacterized alkaline shock family protein YloU